MHLQNLVAQGARFVLAVDDYCRDQTIEGIPVATAAEFLRCKNQYADAAAVDFSQTPYTQAYYAQLARSAGCEFRDLLQVLACFDAPSVYQSMALYRERTHARADDWLKLADRLADDQSRETLYGVLLQRLEQDRRWISDVRIGGRDEYFGVASETGTFSMGQREHFVDCGAHRGTVIQKLLAVTGWQYGSIHAFEPDIENFAALETLTPWPLANFRAHQRAVSDRPETLRFHQTGTMGSCISEAGTSTTHCVKLDDVVEKASFIKLDVEGYEARALRGASRLLREQRPRLAVASYHYAEDLLDIAQVIDEHAPDYSFYLRHHFGYFYDTILYATPRRDWRPLAEAS
ncbi:FkbM family methyltransferase [Variovorax sp. JS1663]|nr:FkbM family methyltransferase [Variovorax sp. JS1663]